MFTDNTRDSAWWNVEFCTDRSHFVAHYLHHAGRNHGPGASANLPVKFRRGESKRLGVLSLRCVSLRVECRDGLRDFARRGRQRKFAHDQYVDWYSNEI